MILTTKNEKLLFLIIVHSIYLLLGYYIADILGFIFGLLIFGTSFILNLKENNLI